MKRILDLPIRRTADIAASARLVLSVYLAVMLLALSGCGGGSSAPGVGITVWQHAPRRSPGSFAGASPEPRSFSERSEFVRGFRELFWRSQRVGGVLAMARLE